MAQPVVESHWESERLWGSPSKPWLTRLSSCFPFGMPFHMDHCTIFWVKACFAAQWVTLGGEPVALEELCGTLIALTGEVVYISVSST
eukprot:732862-Pelagomonas_calceolata.AAC.1